LSAGINCYPMNNEQSEGLVIVNVFRCAVVVDLDVKKQAIMEQLKFTILFDKMKCELTNSTGILGTVSVF
jgi:hypothetical protein